MPALSDPKLEAFAQALLVNIANDMPRTKAAHAAAMKAGYRGSSLGSNARKRAQRKDVKARMAELAAPALAAVEQNITATVDLATKHLLAIATVTLAPDTIKAADVVNSWKTLGQFHGWLAPAEHRVTMRHEDALALLDEPDDVEPVAGSPEPSAQE